MKKFFLSFLLFVFPVFGQIEHHVVLHEEDRELYDTYFHQASEEFDVPVEILQGISFAETRWTHMKWAENDVSSSCTGMPRVYGVMGLWDNDYFGHSLREASLLIGRTTQELKESPLQNIRGGAALLKKLYNELPKPSTTLEGSIESWQNAVSTFSGFPQAEIAAKRALEVYSVIATGYSRDRIEIHQRSIDIAPLKKNVDDLELKNIDHRKQQPEKVLNTPDYPLAKWSAAYSGNFGTQLIQHNFVVIHDVEGSYLGCISWFQNSAAVVSAHFVLNSHPNGVTGTSPNNTPDAPVGEITQMVEEKYRAYHVGCWNSYMVGIEHEGYATVSGWYTPECYNSSAKLVSYLCEKYNIPKDRNHVIGHQEWQNAAWTSWVNSSGQGFDPTCNTHTDPGIYWNWSTFMNLVTAADTVKPKIQSVSHSINKLYPAYKEITVAFNTSMDLTTANNAFSITPSVAGTKSWNSDNTILTFKPTVNFAFNTSYTIKIDTTAKNISLKRTLGPSPYIILFTTVPLDTVGPVIKQSYPYNNAVGVPTKPEVWVQLTDAVITTSLSATLKFVDSNNVSVAMPSAKNDVVDDFGVVTFLPVLKPNQKYRIKLLPGVKDYYNNVSKDTVIIQFTTEPLSMTAAGLTIDQFESNGRGWMQPSQSSNSINIDTSVTKFSFSTDKKVNGSMSGKLAFKFTGNSGGVAEVPVASMPVIDSYSNLGMWINGDMNFNRLQLKFAPGDQLVDLGRIHWRGWKFFTVPVVSLTGSSKKLTSLIIAQDSTVASEGLVYVDDMQLDAAVSNVQPSAQILPKEFSLKQNYPNPFNPSTKITFAVARTEHITLKVYDLLGRELSVLVNDDRSAGTYTVTFDASHLASGLYYYTLRAKDFVQTRKMMLIK